MPGARWRRLQLLGGSAPSVPHALMSNLVSYFKLDETSGARADSHGSISLNDVNTVAYDVGKQGNAGDFERTNLEYLEAVSSTTVNFADTDFSLACWVKPEAADGRLMGMMSKWSGGNTAGDRGYAMIKTTSDELQFTVSSDGTSVASKLSTTTLPAGSWYFCVGFHDATNNLLGVSVNGETISTVAYSSGVFQSLDPFRVGRYGGQHWDGLIDEAMVFNKVLTQGDITYLYAAGVGRTYPLTV